MTLGDPTLRMELERQDGKKSCVVGNLSATTGQPPFQSPGLSLQLEAGWVSNALGRPSRKAGAELHEALRFTGPDKNALGRRGRAMSGRV